MTAQEVKKLFTGKVLFYRCLVEVAGSVHGALMLSQTIYWSDRTDDAEGWFYKTQAEWEDETGLTRYEQEGARAKMLKRGVIEETRKGAKGKLHFRPNYERIAELLTAECGNSTKRKSRTSECGKPAFQNGEFPQSLTYTEITAEITARSGGGKQASFDPAGHRVNGEVRDPLQEGEDLRLQAQRILTGQIEGNFGLFGPAGVTTYHEAVDLLEKLLQHRPALKVAGAEFWQRVETNCRSFKARGHVTPGILKTAIKGVADTWEQEHAPEPAPVTSAAPVQAPPGQEDDPLWGECAGDPNEKIQTPIGPMTRRNWLYNRTSIAAYLRYGKAH